MASSGSPMRKSSAPRMTMPSCSCSSCWCRNEPVGPTRRSARSTAAASSPVMTRRRKPGRSVSLERVVVEEVAVLLAASACAAETSRSAAPASGSRCGARSRLDSAPKLRDLGVEVERAHDRLVLARRPSRRQASSHITSNSMPSGSLAYRLLLAPWSEAPTRAPAAPSRCGSSRGRRGSAPPTPGGTARPAVGRPCSERRASPIAKHARSWWLVEAGRAQEHERAVGVVDDGREAEDSPRRTAGVAVRLARTARRGSFR